MRQKASRPFPRFFWTVPEFEDRGGDVLLLNEIFFIVACRSLASNIREKEYQPRNFGHYLAVKGPIVAIVQVPK
jgi:hypothetical protein